MKKSLLKKVIRVVLAVFILFAIIPLVSVNAYADLRHDSARTPSSIPEGFTYIGYLYTGTYVGQPDVTNLRYYFVKKEGTITITATDGIEYEVDYYRRIRTLSTGAAVNEDDESTFLKCKDGNYDTYGSYSYFDQETLVMLFLRDIGEKTSAEYDAMISSGDIYGMRKIPKPVESVSLDKSTLELEEGQYGTLTATVLPAGATDKTITWLSSDEDIATVSDGTVTAVGIGEAIITAKSNNDETKTAQCTVTVTEPSPTPGPSPSPTPGPSTSPTPGPNPTPAPTKPASNTEQQEETVEESFEPVVVSNNNIGVNNGISGNMPSNTYNFSGCITPNAAIKGINKIVEKNPAQKNISIYSDKPITLNKEFLDNIRNKNITLTYYFMHQGHFYSITITSNVNSSLIFVNSNYEGPLYVGKVLETSRLIK